MSAIIKFSALGAMLQCELKSAFPENRHF